MSIQESIQKYVNTVIDTKLREVGIDPAKPFPKPEDLVPKDIDVDQIKAEVFSELIERLAGSGLTIPAKTPVPAPVPAPVPVPGSGSVTMPIGGGRPDFSVLNAQLFRGQPTFGERILLINGGFVLGSKFLSDLQIRKVVDHLEEQRVIWGPEATKVVMDKEDDPHYPFAANISVSNASMAAHARILGQLKEAMPEYEFGNYDYLPSGGLVKTLEAKHKKQTRDEITLYNNNAKSILLPAVDFVVPQIYAYYNTPGALADWIYSAKETIKEAKRVSDGKPVYPIVWHEFHTGGNVKVPNTYVGDHYWRSILQTVLQSEADGIILWGGWRMKENRVGTFNSEDSYWKIQNEVLGSLS